MRPKAEKSLLMGSDCFLNIGDFGKKTLRGRYYADETLSRAAHVERGAKVKSEIAGMSTRLAEAIGNVAADTSGRDAL